jgi:hypothetical protein
MPYNRKRIAFEAWSTGEYPKGKVPASREPHAVDIPTAGYANGNRVRVRGTYETPRAAPKRTIWKRRKVAP